MVLAATVQVASAGLLVVQALWLADAVAGVVAGAPADSVLLPGLVVAATLAGRGLLAGLAARSADRAATRVMRQLRGAALDRIDRVGLRGESPADLATLLTSGLDQLDGYLVRYLPQLLGTAAVTPLLLVVVFTQDVISGVTMALTLPLVPFFMALVGWTTQRLSDERIARMRRLGDQVLDLIAGLPTLRALGRAAPQSARVEALGQAYRTSTNSVLRIAFLSGFVLEFLTTLSVALVAVGIGMRLVFGELDLQTGLAVLILAPEVYLPLRLVGQHYHASTDGIAAAAAALELLDDAPGVDDDLGAGLDTRASTGLTPARADQTTPAAVRSEAAVRTEAAVRKETELPPVTAVAWHEVSVHHPGPTRATPWRLTGRARAGQVSALVGENGSGKSTALAVLLGLTSGDHGRVVLEAAGNQPVPDGPCREATTGPGDPGAGHTGFDHPGAGETGDDPELTEVTLTASVLPAWHAQVAWVPQHPVVVAGSMAENVELLNPGVTQDELDAVAGPAGLESTIATHGWHAPIGTGGLGLSAGQRQRLALARALVRVNRGARVLLLDEPSAHLDPDTERVVLALLRSVAARGLVVVVVAHRPALVHAADQVIEVSAERLAADVAAPADQACRADQAGDAGDTDQAGRTDQAGPKSSQSHAVRFEPRGAR